MDSALAELCAQTVVYTPQASRDQENAPTRGTPVNYAARVEVKAALVRDANGDVLSAAGRIFLVPIVGAAMPTTQGKVTLPAGVYTRTDPPIVFVQPQIDEAGALDHIVLYFG